MTDTARPDSQQRRARDAVPLHRCPGRRDRGALAGPLGGRGHLRGTQPGRSAGRPGEGGRRARRSTSWTCSRTRPGIGLHVGHPLGYIATDVYGRFKRMTGHNVLHALGFDAFGLPAEQYAVQTGQHPRVTTEANIATMRAQLRRLGLAHDPRRSVATIDVEFYRWTQWIFLQIYNAGTTTRRTGPGRSPSWCRCSPPAPARSRATSPARPRALVGGPGRPGPAARSSTRHRLAYLTESPVNWCPGLGTVLSNEEVTADGRSDRGNFPVFKRDLRQWMHADHGLRRPAAGRPGRAGLAGVRSSCSSATGSAGPRARGSRSRARPATIEVFTTRPDTLFGATFMVLAPEHPMVDRWPPEPGRRRRPDGVDRRRRDAARRRRRPTAEPAELQTDLERQTEGREKTGVFTGGVRRPTRSTARRSRSSSPTTC